MCVSGEIDAYRVLEKIYQLLKVLKKRKQTNGISDTISIIRMCHGVMWKFTASVILITFMSLWDVYLDLPVKLCFKPKVFAVT